MDQKARWKTTNDDTGWLPENGKVPGTEEIIQTKVGQRLDRFGGKNKRSSFLAPADIPIEQCALFNTTDLSIRDEYVVLKPFPVEQSRVMRWFDKEGIEAEERGQRGLIAIFNDEHLAAKYFVWLVLNGRAKISWELFLELTKNSRHCDAARTTKQRLLYGVDN